MARLTLRKSAQVTDTFPFVDLDRVARHSHGVMSAIIRGQREHSPAEYAAVTRAASRRVWGSPTALGTRDMHGTITPSARKLYARGVTAEGLGLVVTVDDTDRHPEHLGPRSHIL